MLTRAVIVGAVLLLGGCGGVAPTQGPGTPGSTAPLPATPGGPSVTRAAATAGPASQTAVPASVGPGQSPGVVATGSPGVTPGAGGWQYLSDFPAGSAIEVTGVTAHGDGFVAVGFEPYQGEGFGGRRNGVVWMSAEGRRWSREVPGDLASTSLLGVVSLGGQLYAFGEYSICPELSEEECLDAPDAGIAMWSSPDGMGWQRLALPDSLRTGILDGALTDGRQLIVHGSTGEELLGAVWLSPDGESWTEVRELAGVDPINALAAGAGRLVAFGIRYLPEEDDVEALAAWSEGGAFAPALLPAGQRGVVQAVTWSEAGFSAVGLEYEPTGDGLASVALASADGVSWTAADPGQLPAGAGYQGVLAVPGGYLALGALPAAAAGREQLFAWSSADGLEWREYGPLAGGAYRQLSSYGRGAAGVIAFASDFEPSDELEPVEQELGTAHAWFLPLDGQGLP